MQKLSRNEVRTIMSTHFPFNGLADEVLDRILSFAVEREFKDREFLFHKGEGGTFMMVVMDGRVRISTVSPEGKELTLNVIETGGILGEIALIDGQERSMDATAIGTCRLLIIRRRDFLPFLEKQPDVAIKLLSILCKKLRDTSEIAENLALLSIPVRLARLLIKFAHSVGEETSKGIQIPLSFSQGELGNLIGATRESVNKYMRQWEKQRLITQDTQYITIVDESRFEEVAEE